MLATELHRLAVELCAQAGEFAAAFLGEQLLLPAQALAHGQKVQLIPHHGAQTHQLVAVRRSPRPHLIRAPFLAGCENCCVLTADLATVKD